jgi:hypothetical protein
MGIERNLRMERRKTSIKGKRREDFKAYPMGFNDNRRKRAINENSFKI